MQRPLAPGRFARSVVCGYCGTTVQIDPSAVSAARYRQALQEWDDPARHGYSHWWSVGTGHWAPGPLIARGELSDVYVAERARRPTERVLLKVLRDPEHGPLLEHEWRMLVELQAAIGNEAPAFLTRLPQPVAHGPLRGGAYEGRQALLVRRPPATSTPSRPCAGCMPRAWIRACPCGCGGASWRRSRCCTARATCTARCCPRTCSCNTASMACGSWASAARIA
ncbi:hypothetical protein ACN28S_51465 [Cystobacter fuscus]